MSAEMQQKINAARQNSLGRSRSIVRSGAALTRSTTGMNRTLPWTAAVNFIETAPVEKIELSTGLSIKLIMKNAPTFTAIQPTKDAYLVPLKKAKAKIEVVK
jgi:predicted methyltransferase